MKDSKKFFKVSKLIYQKEADTAILKKPQRLSADMLELKEDMEDVKSTLKRLGFNDAMTQNIRRRKMGLQLQKVPFIVGDGPTSQVSSIQSLEMIDMLSLRNCQLFLLPFIVGDGPTSQISGIQSLEMIDNFLKSTNQSFLGFVC